MLQAYPLTALASLVAATVYIGTLVNAGLARGRTGLIAPAVTGNAEFERYYRVQMNTVEQMVVLFPVLALCALWVGDGWAALGGLIWSVGRILYARAYYTAAEKCGPGFGLSVLPIFAMLLASLVAVVRVVI